MAMLGCKGNAEKILYSNSCSQPGMPIIPSSIQLHHRCHHSFRSFLGITCLIQISTSDTDYVIDALALRDHLSLLNEVFTDPKIVKVRQFHFDVFNFLKGNFYFIWFCMNLPAKIKL
ncbi:unnamed protein product [Trichobilharzia regenti]|nr:unnamed protein product [Trichobilharzia regenti]